MAAPRLEVADDAGTSLTGNPILDSANALNSDSSTNITSSSQQQPNSNSTFLSDPSNTNRPSQSSPLKSSTTAADLGRDDGLLQQQQQSHSAMTEDSQKSTAEPVENVLTAIGGAAAAAPLAALEAISAKVPGLVNIAKQQTSTLADNLSKNETIVNTSQASKATIDNATTNVTNTASNLVNQASTYVHQALDNLPEGITSKLPSQITNLVGAGGNNAKTPSHHEEMPVGPETRETTSAPILDAGSTRPQAVLKAPVAGTTTTADTTGGGQTNAAAPVAATEEDDFTKPHRTGIFEASGSLQATHNPELVEAQSDLAVRAENGDL